MNKAYAIWMTLGMCSGYHPTDADMTRYLCGRQFHASLLPIAPEEDTEAEDRGIFTYRCGRQLSTGQNTLHLSLPNKPTRKDVAAEILGVLSRRQLIAIATIEDFL